MEALLFYRDNNYYLGRNNHIRRAYCNDMRSKALAALNKSINQEHDYNRLVNSRVAENVPESVPESVPELPKDKPELIRETSTIIQELEKERNEKRRLSETMDNIISASEEEYNSTLQSLERMEKALNQLQLNTSNITAPTINSARRMNLIKEELKKRKNNIAATKKRTLEKRIN